MKANKIKVIVKRPEQLPTEETIDNTLEALQKAVDGYIETVYAPGGGVFIVNEEGLLQNLAYNFSILKSGFFPVHFFGTVLFVGDDGEEFTDSPIDLPTFVARFGKEMGVQQ